MLHTIYYIVKPGILEQPIKIGADAVIALEIEPGNEDHNTLIFQLAEKYITDTSFCLLIQLQESLTSGQATDLIAFLFFSNYHKPGGAPHIIVGGKNISIIKSSIEQLHKTAGEQGFTTLQITPASTLPMVFTSGNQSAIRETYRAWLQSPTGTTNTFYIYVAQWAHLNITNEVLQAEETLFNQQNPGLYMLKIQTRDLDTRVHYLEQCCKAARQEISNQASHNQILRSSSQATALQNYYDNEYEVLPLWFKRLGHIVKAFMGKRSFKSLYSDKVKKYKD